MSVISVKFLFASVSNSVGPRTGWAALRVKCTAVVVIMLLSLGLLDAPPDRLIAQEVESIRTPAGGSALAPPVDESARLNALLEDYFEELLRMSPVYASSIGDHRYDDQFANDISPEYRTKYKDLFSRYLTRLSAINRSRLTGQDRLSYDQFRFEAELAVEGMRYEDHLTPVNQFYDNTSLFAELASGQSLHPFKTVKDYDNFLTRIAAFPAWVDTAIANMRVGAAKGIVQPRVLMEKKIPQIEKLLVSDPKHSIFYQPIASMPADFPPSDKERLTAAYSKAISDTIYPAYRKLNGFIRTEYLPKTRTTIGLSAVPGGSRQYAFAVRSTTTTDLTPEEIHRIGLAEVARIRAEMEKVREQVGFKGDLKAFFEHIRADRRFYPFKTEEEVLAAYRSIESRVQGNIPKYFGVIPKSKFEIRPTEKFRAAEAAASYTAGTPDGSRPGVFEVPIPDPAKHQSPGMERLFLHEAIPGHHYQISLQQEQTGLPRFRKFGGNGAYTEGWGLYAESLGKELGLYTDPYQYFGMLSGEMHRAIRLVLDTVIHAEGWTRERAIKYSLENEPLPEEAVIAEVERYIAWPSQALAYKIGQLKIIELRRRAEQSLGPKFILREFHDEVLKDGALPLRVLEIKIDEWIARRRQ